MTADTWEALVLHALPATMKQLCALLRQDVYHLRSVLYRLHQKGLVIRPGERTRGQMYRQAPPGDAR